MTAEPDSSTPLLNKNKPTAETESTRQTASAAAPTKSVNNTAAAFRFWFYFLLIVSLITLSGLLLSSLAPQDPKTWFLNIPEQLRDHYSNGRTIKVQMARNQPEVEIFSVQQGPSNSESRVLIIHGVGCSSFSFRGIVNFLGQSNVHAVAIDLPGSGFSDRSAVVMEESEGESNLFSRLGDVYEDIKTKGLFWGFDQLVEQGYVNVEEIQRRTSMKESIKPIYLGGEEVGKVLGQVVDTLGLAPVDLVLHDSALALSANWILENRGLIRSLLLLDTAPSSPALPLFLFQVPVLRHLVLELGFLFQRFLEICCTKSVCRQEAEAHRVLLKGRDWGSTVFGMGKKLNTSFDVSEWISQDEIKSLPIRVIWSEQWSDQWSSEGQKLAAAIPHATLSAHSGGRWVQEGNGEELGRHIAEFVSSQPKTTRPAEVGHGHGTQAEAGAHSHGDSGHHDDFTVAHPGYAGAYGLGDGWSM